MASWANQIRAGSNTDATSYVTATINVTTGKPIAFLVENSRASAAATPTLTVPSGVTATELGTVTFVGGARRLTLFWLVGSGSGTVTIDFGASTQTACIWSADEGTTASTTAPTGGDIVTNSGGSASSGSADLTSITSGNHVYAGVGTNTGITIDPGSGFTEVGTEASTTTPAMTITTEYRNASDDPTADFTFGTASSWAVIAIEVAPSAAGVTGTAAADFGGLTAAAAGTRKVNGTAVGSFGGLTAAAAGTRGTAGTAAAAFGGLTATAVGTRKVNGAALADLGGLTASAVGAGAAPTVTGTGAANLGGLTATAAGTRTVLGTAAASFGGLTATGDGDRSILGTAAAAFGGLTATATGRRTVLGVALADLGGLTAVAIGSTEGPATWRRLEGDLVTSSRDDGPLVTSSRDDAAMTTAGRRDGG